MAAEGMQSHDQSCGNCPTASHPATKKGRINAPILPKPARCAKSDRLLGSGLLFAVNAGRSDVSMFAVRGTDLVLLDRKPAGGQMPVSVAVNRIRVYVVNAGGTPNISGFTIDPIGGRPESLPPPTLPLADGT